MARAATLAMMFLVAHAPLAQEGVLPAIRSNSTLVSVPTLVRLPSGEVAKDLNADRFQLLDNGVPQKVRLEPTQKQPIALVVLMQTGGTGPGEFGTYRNLPRLVNSIIGDSIHEIMLVTFDSKIEATWHFPPRYGGVTYALTHPIAGDDGAAILDAVNYVIGLLQQEPGDFRRIVLLLSQSRDDGSETYTEKVVQQLGESSTGVYSLTFVPRRPPAQFRSKNQVANHGSSKKSAGGPQNDAEDLSTPLGVALKAMRTSTAEEIATLSGGEHLKFRDQAELEDQLSVAAKDIHNRYLLSFQPATHEPGFHTLTVRVAEPKTNQITARTSYWFDAGAAGQ